MWDSRDAVGNGYTCSVYMASDNVTHKLGKPSCRRQHQTAISL